MVKRSIAISSPGELKIKNRQLVHLQGATLINTAPLEDIALIVVETAETTWTSALLAECADCGIAVVFCGTKHLPTGILQPVVGNHLMSYTHRHQLQAKLPTKKRLWQTIITAKILAQAQTLRANGLPDAILRGLAQKIKSGDSTNMEGVAAAKYFPLLFGADFIRDSDGEGLNSRLNYGYAILRAAVVRAIVLSGLNPSVGIWHHNRFNPFPLADDLMEPLRPMVDQIVLDSLSIEAERSNLTPEIKRSLLKVLTAEIGWDGARFPLDSTLQRYCAQVREALIHGGGDVQCPAL